MISRMIAPLDIQSYGIIFAGSLFLLEVVILVGIGMLAARFKMPSIILALVVALFAVIMMIWAMWLLFLVLIIGGLVAYYIITKLVKN